MRTLADLPVARTRRSSSEPTLFELAEIHAARRRAEDAHDDVVVRESRAIRTANEYRPRRRRNYEDR